MATSPDLRLLKLPELRALAKSMRLRGTSLMRKPELIQVIEAVRSGGAAPAGVTVKLTDKDLATLKNQPRSDASNDNASNSDDEQSDNHAGLRRSDRSAVSQRSDARQSQTSWQRGNAGASDSFKLDDNDNTGDHDVLQLDDIIASLPGEAAEATNARQPRRRGHNDHALRRFAPRNDERDTDNERSSRTQRAADPQRSDNSDRSDRAGRVDRGDDETSNDRRMRRLRSRDRDDQPRSDRAASDNGDRKERRGRTDQLNGSRGNDRAEQGTTQRNTDRNDRNAARNESRNDRNDNRYDRGERNEHRNDRSDRADRGDESRNRTQQANDEFVNDTLLDELDLPQAVDEHGDAATIAGVVDILESYGFVRTSGYLPGPNDVYLSMSQIKKYGLRKGDAVTGSIKLPSGNDRRNQRQKFVPLHTVETINGLSVDETANRPQFAKLTPLYPQERLKQETVASKITGRLVDLVAPIGKGQRGLIVSPPKAGKTLALQAIANAITDNNPEVHLMVVLVDERPEEVTDMQRTVRGEIISSTFDRPASDHTTVAELAIERAKRLVELGQDVVVLLDSMTRLARAYNIAMPASGRILSGGVDAQALYPPKKFFGAARNIEGGGSLTIIATALVETGSKMDEVIFEEFKGTGNMELRLNRQLADKRMYPAIDVNGSGTRREEMITPADELAIIFRLRRLLGDLEPEQAYQMLVPRLKKTANNREFLSSMMQQAQTSAQQ